jgi:hypothetical protein
LDVSVPHTYVVFDYPSQTATLASLARTSRLFSEIALDILWWKQFSLIPLLQCLPNHVWDMADSNPMNGSPRFVRSHAFTQNL